MTILSLYVTRYSYVSTCDHNSLNFSLMAHIEVVHREKKPMRCEVSRECGFEAGTTLTLKQHEKICPMKNSS